MSGVGTRVDVALPSSCLKAGKMSVVAPQRRGSRGTPGDHLGLLCLETVPAPGGLGRSTGGACGVVAGLAHRPLCIEVWSARKLDHAEYVPKLPSSTTLAQVR